MPRSFLPAWLLAVPALVFTAAHAAAQNEEPLRLTLEGALRRAMAENFSLRAAREGVGAQAARVRQAEAMRYPALSVTAFATGGSPQIYATPNPVGPSTLMAAPGGQFGALNLMLMAPISTGGRLQAMAAMEQARKRRREAEQSSAELEIAFQVKEAYGRILFLQEMLRAREAFVERTEEQWRVDQEAFAAGKIPRYTLYRTQAELADARQAAAEAARDLQTALIEIKRLTVVPQDTPVLVEGTLETPPLPLSAGELREMALRRNQVLLEAKQMVEEMSHSERVARSAFAPQVQLAAMSDTMKAGSMEVRSLTSFGVAAALPLYDRGSRREALAEAEAFKRQAELRLREKTWEVEAEVAKTVVEIETAWQNTQTAREVLRAAEEEYSVAKLRYEAGKGIQLELLDASAAWLRATANHLQALYQHWEAVARLEMLVGGELLERAGEE